jgi:class 3 adenylate cyclase
MARLNLKSIVGKNQMLHGIVEGLISQLNSEIWIEEINGNVLLGSSGKHPEIAFPVLFQNEVLGWVKGDEQGKIIADLLNERVEKDAEKKKLGGEVLNLYQQINIIFNFTEALTQTIEPEVIARLTLEQAVHSITSHSGIIVLWDDRSHELQILAVSGETLFNEENISSNASLLLKIGLTGQSEIVTDIAPLKENGIVKDSAQAIIYAAMKVKHRIMGAIILAGKDADQFSAAHLKLLVTLALQSSGAIESALLYEKNIREAREREEAILRIHEVTKKFVPNEFIRSLGKEKLTDVKLGDQVEKIVTVLFTDIRDFTTLSEMMTPEENFRFVSSFNSQLGPIIRSNNGFINQYLGDSIMAIFPDNAGDAIQAAIAMQVAVRELNATRIENGLRPIQAGIGMHTGPLIMGITGDEQRLDAATISDTVNTAARIESLTKYYNAPLLMSEETINQIEGEHHFNIRMLGSVRLKGKLKLLNIIECFDGHGPDEFDKKMKSLPLFNKGMEFYRNQQFEEAVQFFKSVLAINPGDQTGNYFLEKAIRYQHENVPQNWTGSEEMLNK